MKKQIVLSLSIIVCALSSELFAPAYGVRRNNSTSNTPPAAPTRQVPPASNSGTPPAQAVPASAEDAAKKCSLNGVAGALRKLGANPDNATQSEIDVAEAFIQTGMVPQTSSNSSNKLGRLGK